VIEIAFFLVPNMESTAETDPILVIRLTVGMDIVWDMLPYPSARRSVVTRKAFQDARNRFEVGTSIDRELPLTGLLIFGQPVPDLVVRPSLAPTG